MKKTLLFLFISLCPICAIVSESAAIDTTTIHKTGWNFGPLPVVSFNSDLGFQYGVCCEQTLAYLLYDSNYLIPGIRSVFVASYQLDPMYYFYGFNYIF